MRPGFWSPIVLLCFPMCALFWLVLPSTWAKFPRKTYSTTRRPTGSATFVECFFKRCQSDADGGAVLFNHGSCTVTVAACLFLSCRSSWSGGAICLSSVLSFSANDTSGSSCSANSGGFCYVSLDRSEAGKSSNADAHRLSITACHAET